MGSRRVEVGEKEERRWRKGLRRWGRSPWLSPALNRGVVRSLYFSPAGTHRRAFGPFLYLCLRAFAMPSGLNSTICFSETSFGS